MDHADLVRQQFGANAANYATSPVHAKGASLARLIEVVDPQPGWHGLDIATAAGHTAFAAAETVAHMIASDLTPEMLDVARAQAVERAIGNVSVEAADAEDLPFDDGAFDLVTCRIAPHHFEHPDRFVNEVARVLKPGGVFGLCDNVVPDDAEVAAFANDFEKRRDPSHVRCLSLDEWIGLLVDAGLDVEHSELLAKRMDFAQWADNMDVAADLRVELLADLERATPDAAAFLRPELGAPGQQDGAAFYLTECIVRSVKRA